MAGPAVAHVYRYRAASALDERSRSPALRLATSGGPEENPHFFTGTLAHPRLTAQLLRTLSRIVQTRYHVPPAMLAKIVALADPVITSGSGLLRFEGFSSCASAYARVDLLPAAFSKCVEVSPGTTNVDFNADMRSALARVRDSDALGLSVGAREVVLDRAAGSVVERKVPLPLRWLKGFVEVQAYQAAMELRLEMRTTEAARFLRALPRAKTGKSTFWVVPSGPVFRLSQRATRESVRVTGTERLRPLEDLAPYARGLRAYSDERGGASAWELDFGFARFVLAVSAEVWRGFSGEGQVLSGLAARDEKLITRARAALQWNQQIKSAELASRLRVSAKEISRALAALGARGLVGYDLSVAGYFHRELPFDLSQVEALQPRLKAARKLVTEDGVTLLAPKDGTIEADVRGSGVVHRVRMSESAARCTCPWYAKHQGGRGPCKHVLAVEIVLEDSEWRSPSRQATSRASSKRAT